MQKRKPPPFKPPRPTKALPSEREKPARQRASVGAATTASRVAKKNSTAAAVARAKARPGFKKASLPLEDEEDEEDEDENEEDGHSRNRSRAPPRTNPTNDISDSDESSTAKSPDPPTSRRASTTTANRADAAEEAPTAGIPRKLLARLLQDGFEDAGTKVGKEAMTVVSKYMETFVREALARAAFEREGGDGEGLWVGVLGGYGRLRERFADSRALGQVEDLEKLAPQLLLDF